MRDNIIYIVSMIATLLVWASVPYPAVTILCMGIVALLSVWFIGKDL